MDYTAHFQSVTPFGNYRDFSETISIDYKYSSKEKDRIKNLSQNELLKYSEFPGASKLCKKIENCGITFHECINEKTNERDFFVLEDGENFLDEKYSRFDSVLFEASHKLQSLYRLPFFKKDLEKDEKVCIENNLMLRNDVYNHGAKHHKKIKNAYDFLVNLSYTLNETMIRMSHTVLKESSQFYELHWERFNQTSIKIIVYESTVYLSKKDGEHLIYSLDEYKIFANSF